MTYPWSSGDVLTASDMNALPGGVVVNTRLGGATATTTTVTVTNQNILIDSTTLVSGRKYLCLVKIGTCGNPSTTLTVRARVFVEGSRRDSIETTLTSGGYLTLAGSLVFTASGGGGNHYIEIDANTGSFDIMTLDNVTESSFVIIDLGTN
jgi:hypothetical protein